KRRKIIHKILRFLCCFKICNTKFQIKIYGKISRRECNQMSESGALRAKQNLTSKAKSQAKMKFQSKSRIPQQKQSR
ncbi:MAG: hypothetical protein ACLVCW_08135, partial [Campylobacter sp.]